MAFLGVPLVLIYFSPGAAFSFYVMLPFALSYLASFGSDIREGKLELVRVPYF